MIGRTIGEVGVGDAAELSRTASAADLAAFVDAVGDRNPVHSDPVYAARTPFGGPIAPGIWTAGLVSAVIGTRLPGPGTIYETQDLRFLRPVRPGENVTARVEVMEVHRDRNRVRLRTTCRNGRGEEVLSGEAWVLPPKSPVRYEEHGQPVAPLSLWAIQPLAWAARCCAFWWGLRT